MFPTDFEEPALTPSPSDLAEPALCPLRFVGDRCCRRPHSPRPFSVLLNLAGPRVVSIPLQFRGTCIVSAPHRFGGTSPGSTPFQFCGGQLCLHPPTILAGWLCLHAPCDFGAAGSGFIPLRFGGPAQVPSSCGGTKGCTSSSWHQRPHSYLPPKQPCML